MVAVQIVERAHQRGREVAGIVARRGSGLAGGAAQEVAEGRIAALDARHQRRGFLKHIFRARGIASASRTPRRQHSLSATRLQFCQCSGLRTRFRRGLIEHKIGCSHPMPMRPGDLLNIAEAATLPPTHFGVNASAPTIYARKSRGNVLNKWNGQWNSDGPNRHGNRC